MSTRRVFYRWDLTPHQRAALLHVLSEYLMRADATEVSIDAATGAEIPLGDLLKQLIDLEPTTAEVTVRPVRGRRPAGPPTADVHQAVRAVGEAFELHKPPGFNLVAVFYDQHRVIGTGSDADLLRAIRATEEWAALERQTSGTKQ